MYTYRLQNIKLHVMRTCGVVKYPCKLSIVQHQFKIFLVYEKSYKLPS